MLAELLLCAGVRLWPQKFTDDGGLRRGVEVAQELELGRECLATCQVMCGETHSLACAVISAEGLSSSVHCVHFCDDLRDTLCFQESDRPSKCSLVYYICSKKIIR